MGLFIESVYVPDPKTFLSFFQPISILHILLHLCRAGSGLGEVHGAGGGAVGRAVHHVRLAAAGAALGVDADSDASGDRVREVVGGATESVGGVDNEGLVFADGSEPGGRGAEQEVGKETKREERRSMV